MKYLNRKISFDVADHGLSAEGRAFNVISHPANKNKQN